MEVNVLTEDLKTLKFEIFLDTMIIYDLKQLIFNKCGYPID